MLLLLFNASIFVYLVWMLPLILPLDVLMPLLLINAPASIYLVWLLLLTLLLVCSVCVFLLRVHQPTLFLTSLMEMPSTIVTKTDNACYGKRLHLGSLFRLRSPTL